MNILNDDIMRHIGSFMERSDIVLLCNTSKSLTYSDQLLKSQYHKTFGEINESCLIDKKIIVSLLCCGQPDATVNHNIYTAPNNCLERWKWMLGVENSLDKEVQEIYHKKIDLLENTQAASIIQLKNQLKGFWHADRQIKDYAEFKLQEKARATTSLMGEIFFGCLRFFFKLFYPSSVLNAGKKLEDRSRETFAKIGAFELDGKDYNVVAFSILADEKSAHQYKIYQDATQCKFDSVTGGITHIGIFETNQPHSLKSLGHWGSNANFNVLIGREEVGKKWFSLLSENNRKHGIDAVSDSSRHLIIGSGLEYRGSTQDLQGSDRLLDQKLTQIMVEMAMQNKRIISLDVESNHDDLSVLTAGGFESCKTKAMLKELIEFRSKAENKLFPPYQDYLSVSTKFNTKNLHEKNAYFSREFPESWSTILQRGPILKPEAGILPEYWARKPNIINQ